MLAGAFRNVGGKIQDRARWPWAVPLFPWKKARAPDGSVAVTLQVADLSFHVLAYNLNQIARPSQQDLTRRNTRDRGASGWLMSQNKFEMDWGLKSPMSATTSPGLTWDRCDVLRDRTSSIDSSIFFTHHEGIVFSLPTLPECGR